MFLYKDGGVQKTPCAFAYGETIQQIADGGDVSVKVLTHSGTLSAMTLPKEKGSEEVNTFHNFNKSTIPNQVSGVHAKEVLCPTFAFYCSSDVIVQFINLIAVAVTCWI